SCCRSAGRLLGFFGGQFFQVDVAVADARVQAAAIGAAQDHNDFVGTRCVFDLHFQGDVVRTQAFVVLVHHRDLDRGARAAALVGEAQVALGLDRFAVM